MVILFLSDELTAINFPCGFLFKNISIILPPYITLSFSLCHIIFYEVCVFIYSYSYYQPVSMSRWRAHTRAVVVQTLHRGQRDTGLCPYLINYATLYPITFPQLRESSISTPSFNLPSNLYPPFQKLPLSPLTSSYQ